MPKSPEFRIIGSGSEEQKDEVKKELENKFLHQVESLDLEDRKKLEEVEIKKTEKVKAGINFANKETDRLMTELGLEPFDVPEDNYIIVPNEMYRKAAGDDKANATTFYREQAIIVDGEYFGDRSLLMSKTILHETLHLKGHFTMEVSAKGKKTPYREGVGIRATQKSFEEQGYHEHFRGLHEAIVSAQEKKSFPALMEAPEFAEERKWLESEEAQKLIKEVHEKKGVKMDEIEWVDPKDDKDRIRWFTDAYEGPRKVLKYVCEQIQEQFKDEYQTPDAVFQEFLKAQFSGQLLTIARLVEKTFGDGSFRLLGNMEPKDDSAVAHLEHLKKNRGRQI